MQFGSVIFRSACVRIGTSVFEAAALQLVDPDRAFVEIDESPAHPERFGLAEP
jgi:hypothetical protein